MELQTGWIMIPLMLVGGIFYSIIRRYIYGIALVSFTVVISVINLAYYMAGFFLQDKAALSLFVIPGLLLLFIAWLIIAILSAIRQFRSQHPTTVMSLILNIVLITVWNVLIYISFFPSIP